MQTPLPQENGSINTKNQGQDVPTLDNEITSTSGPEILAVYSKFDLIAGDT
ncbi:MAG: hypothetical protein ACJAU2_001474 [Maribacter sp.]|jgi:hypothetical protein